MVGLVVFMLSVWEEKLGLILALDIIVLALSLSLSLSVLENVGLFLWVVVG